MPEDDFDSGWDASAVLVDGRWVDRTPRRAEVAPQLRRETELLPWLAPRLPLPVPTPVIVSEDPLTVRHAYLPGGACPGTSAAQGRAVGRFLVGLHAVDVDEAVAHGAPDAATTVSAVRGHLERMQQEVLPLLPRGLASAGRALLDRMAAPPSDPRLIHGDLGPEHIRVMGDRVTGVIDWGDACIGDPALDLAWTMVGAGPPFADAVEAAYRPEEPVVGRARDWHMLGPWHEVLYGLDLGGAAYVESGLRGTVTRLERWGRLSRGRARPDG